MLNLVPKDIKIQNQKVQIPIDPSPPVTPSAEEVTPIIPKDSQIPASSFPTLDQTANYSPNIPASSPVFSPTDQNQKGDPAHLPTPDKPKPPSKFFALKLLLAILFFSLVLFFAAGLTAAYNNYKIFAPPKFIQNTADFIILAAPLPKTPRIILAATQAKTASLQTATAETEFLFTTDSNTFIVKKASFKIKSPLDFKSQNQIRAEADISGEIEIEGLSAKASGSVKQIGDTFYFKLDEFPAGSLLPLDSLKNTWFYINNPKEPEKENSQIKEKLTQIKKLLEEFVGKSKDWSQLDSSDSSFYKVKILPPKEEITNFIFEVIKIVEPQDTTAVEEDLARENLEKFIKNLKDIQLVLKINKGDQFIKEAQIEIPFTVDIPASSNRQGVNLAPQTPTDMKIKITTSFSAYNQQVVIDIPQNAQDFIKYQKEYEDSLKKNLQMYKAEPEIPDESLLPDNQNGDDLNIEDETSFRNFLEGDDQTLGKKNTPWDLILLSLLGGI